MWPHEASFCLDDDKDNSNDNDKDEDENDDDDDEDVDYDDDDAGEKELDDTDAATAAVERVCLCVACCVRGKLNEKHFSNFLSSISNEML